MTGERDTAADFKLIQDALGMEPDQAAEQAIGVLADIIRQDCVIMTREDLHMAMLSYAVRALSVHEGEQMAAVPQKDGTMGFVKTGRPLSSPVPCAPPLGNQ